MVPDGTVAYKVGAYPCSGTGVEWTVEQTRIALEGEVLRIAYDLVGFAEMEVSLGSLVDSVYAKEMALETLRGLGKVDRWRVGEAIAEAYLTAHRDCVFPWPVERDMRGEGSSVPGTDLVGLRKDGAGHRFAFCEVKTSADRRSPPRVVSGKHGLEEQLSRICRKKDVRFRMVVYLVRRLKEERGKSRLRSATMNYRRDSTDVYVCGFLVRDTTPNEKDVAGCVFSLRQRRYGSTEAEVITLYLPGGHVMRLSEILLDSIKRGFSWD